MQIAIDHETTYSYAEPVAYSIQSLRLTPQAYHGQVVRSWSVTVPGAGTLPVAADCFGNLTHTAVMERPHDRLTVRVRGLVDTFDTHGVVSGTVEPFRPALYLRETGLTAADGAIRALARSACQGSDSPLDCLHRLMHAVRDAIDYETGQTETTTDAVQALNKGVGVCQDHAHVFIAAARSLGIPARYVSGYLMSTEGGVEADAAHAWAEALVPDLGWVGFDVANRVCPTEFHVRVSVGLDYREAAPMRGIRRGGGDGSLAVTVRVGPAGAAVQ
jgi:transglutaminase-like putative cysteine protease